MNIFDLQKVSSTDLGRTLSSYLLELEYDNNDRCIKDNDYFKYIDMSKIIIGKCRKRNNSSDIRVDGYYVSMEIVMHVDDYHINETDASHLKIYKDIKEFYYDAAKISCFLNKMDFLKKEINNKYASNNVLNEEVCNKYDNISITTDELPKDILHHEIFPEKNKFFLLDLDSIDKKYYEMPMKDIKDIIEKSYEEYYSKYISLYNKKYKYIEQKFFSNDSIFYIQDIIKHTCEFKGTIIKFSSNGVSYEKDKILDVYLLSEDKVYEYDENLFLSFKKIKILIEDLFYELIKEYTQLATF